LVGYPDREGGNGEDPDASRLSAHDNVFIASAWIRHWPLT
jgi:hypothetical protein